MLLFCLTINCVDKQLNIKACCSNKDNSFKKNQFSIIDHRPKFIFLPTKLIYYLKIINISALNLNSMVSWRQENSYVKIYFRQIVWLKLKIDLE
jgi:hypothetical protein